ncbi:hypothetical protein Efla_007246 [Eimeria flavescens]
MDASSGVQEGPVSYLRHSTFASRPAARFVSLQSWRDGATLPLATTRETYKKDVAPLMNAPAWDVMEQKVLKFSAYFNEHVDESREGNYRTRICEIMYYLEDDTMEVVEPKRDNSGMLHGTLIKRHRFPNEARPGRLASPADLRIGGTFSVYGKTFAITACDAFTRVNFMNCLSAHAGGQRRTYAQQSKMQQIDRRSESPGLCGVSATLQVCRFSASLKDTFTSVLETRLFTILYFLSDKTIEIQENLPPRGVNRRFSIFLRRGRVLRGNRAIAGPADHLPPESAYLHLADFQVGATVVIADREFFIYAADDLTRSFVKDTLGLELRQSIEDEAHHAGGSSAADPEGINVKSEHGHISEDHVSDEGGKKALSYTALLEGHDCFSGAPHIVNIVYYPDDKSLSVTKCGDKICGCGTAQRLKRAVYQSQVLGRPFESQDFVVGSRITVQNQTFRLLSENSFKDRLQGPCSDGRSHQRVLIYLKRLWEGLRGNDIETMKMFTSCDEKRNCHLTYRDFQVAMKRFGYSISQQEALAMTRYFDASGDGKVDFAEFCKGLSDLHTSFLGKNKRVDDLLECDLEEYRRAAKAEHSKLEKTKAVTGSLKKVQAHFYQQPRLHKMLMKEFSRSALGRTVPLEEAVQVFRRCGCKQSEEEIRSAIEALVPEAGLQDIDYIRLISTSLHSLLHLVGPQVHLLWNLTDTDAEETAQNFVADKPITRGAAADTSRGVLASFFPLRADTTELLLSAFVHKSTDAKSRGKTNLSQCTTL